MNIHKAEITRRDAIKMGKPLVASECCWGALDDAVRVESVRYTLTQLRARNIGWLV